MTYKSVIWQPTNKKSCPLCNGETEVAIYIDQIDDSEYIIAERCTHCRWIVDFEADEIKVVRY